MTQKDVLQPVDDAARHLAGDLLRLAPHAALASLEPGTGAPMASRVSLATMVDGRPLILISRLSAHFGALEADSRASILVGESGSGDPLAHPRMTVMGRAEKVSEVEREGAKARFLNRHPSAKLYADFADFAFWTITPDKASLNGGFAKAYALGPNDLLTTPDERFLAHEAGAVAHMNADHADAVALYAERLLGLAPGRWRLTGADPQGLDLALGAEAARLWFDRPLTGFEELRPMVVALAKRARG